MLAGRHAEAETIWKQFEHDLSLGLREDAARYESGH